MSDHVGTDPVRIQIVICDPAGRQLAVLSPSNLLGPGDTYSWTYPPDGWVEVSDA